MDSLTDTSNQSIIESFSQPQEDEPLDPRIQIELERLNHANEAINQLENQLDEARKTFHDFRTKAENELSQLEKNIGDAVYKARGYYEARIRLRDAKDALIKAKHRFERAQELHLAAKELAVASADYIDEAERTNQNATAWNETYFQAIQKISEAEKEKYEADYAQQVAETAFSDIEKLVAKLQKELRRSINKSKPYYEMRVQYHQELDFQKRKIYGLERCVSEAKSQYQESLRNLEHISNEIHEQRTRKHSQKESDEQTLKPQVSSKPIPYLKNSSISPVRKTYSDSVLRSCLLRTETLPPGIFTNTKEQSSSSLDEKLDGTVSDTNDQFVLCSTEAPRPSLITTVDQPKKVLTNISRERSPNGTLRISRLTDDQDDDNKSISLHVLSDDQLHHLNSMDESYPADLASPTDMHGQSFEQSNGMLSESVLY